MTSEEVCRAEGLMRWGAPAVCQQACATGPRNTNLRPSWSSDLSRVWVRRWTGRGRFRHKSQHRWRREARNHVALEPGRGCRQGPWGGAVWGGSRGAGPRCSCRLSCLAPVSSSVALQERQRGTARPLLTQHPFFIFGVLLASWRFLFYFCICNLCLDTCRSALSCLLPCPSHLESSIQLASAACLWNRCKYGMFYCEFWFLFWRPVAPQYYCSLDRLYQKIIEDLKSFFVCGLCLLMFIVWKMT